jgi:hypothetical protein
MKVQRAGWNTTTEELPRAYLRPFVARQTARPMRPNGMMALCSMSTVWSFFMKSTARPMSPMTTVSRSM